MLIQDMKHSCMEQIIELQRCDANKKEKFNNNEPVRIVSQGSYIIIQSLKEEGKILKVTPINDHTKSVIYHIMNVDSLCLCEIIMDKNKEIQVLVKQYPEVRQMDCSVLVSDEFIRTKLARQIQLRNVMKPQQEMTDNSVYHLNNQESYFIIGTHVRQEDAKDNYDEFVIAAKDFYIHVKKKTEENREYFDAEKVSKGIKVKDYKFILVRGNITFSDEREEIKEQVKQALGRMSDDMYIKVWDQYGALEEKMVMNRLRKTGAIRFVSYEPGMNYVVRFDLADGSEEKLVKFAEALKKGDMISILPINPFHRTMEDLEFRNFLDSRDVTNNIVNGKISENINVNSGRIFIAIDDVNFVRLKQISEGFIFLSIFGDKQRLDRRENARLQIERMTCPMPDLAAILEGKRGSVPKKTNIPALSPTLLEDDKFKNLTPNQIEAIRIALNTPDIALIQGPPGTGKTTVITAIIKRLEEEADLSGGMFGRSLITAFQHDAVQNATDRLRILGLPAIKFGKKYSDIEDDSNEINTTIQHWINEKLTDLNVKHADARNIEYMFDFNKLYINYMKSAVSIAQTLSILKDIRDEVESKLSYELSERLNRQIYELNFQSNDDSDDSSDILIRTIRRIPTNEIAMEDNGRGAIRRVIARLESQQDDYLVPYINELKSIVERDQYDFGRIRFIKKQLLIHVIPKENVFTTQGKRSEIDYLLRDISEYLQKQIEESKKGEDLIFLEYMQSIEENPMAVKKAILDYSVVNGATNQQVMRKEIRDLKGGDIVYDNVLVDEAARSNPLDLFIPMSVAKDRIILVGDHRQLPHIIDDEIVNELEKKVVDNSLINIIEKRIKESMFEQLFYKLRMLEEQKPKITRIITLDKQFRMHPTIGSFVNKNFYKIYEENVENGITDPSKFAHSLPGIENKACIWYDIPLKLGRERDAQSKSRQIEADKIAKHLKEMLDSSEGKKYSYGIITFYRDQVDLINKALSKPSIGIYVKDETGKYNIAPDYWNDAYGDQEYIKVGTVDAFQGMEFDVVYLSMVRSNDDTITAIPVRKDEQISKKREKELRHKYGFLMYENRLCVAMSRGKKALICVGDSGMLEGECALEAVPSLVDYHKLCKEDEYGIII